MLRAAVEPVALNKMQAAKKTSGTRMTVHGRSSRPRRGPTCVDLFAGAGGFAEGFRQAGWSVLAANDIDVYASETFRRNFPETVFFEGPISEIDPAQLLREAGIKRGALDCLIGGPPCQSFSYNNHQRSATDHRAQLFRKYLAIVEALLPKTIVMENVPGMLTIGNGKIVAEIKRQLGRIGYECDVGILFSEDFGVPQTRRRAFVVATRLGRKRPLLPAGSHGPSDKPSPESNKFVFRWNPTAHKKPLPFVTVRDALADLPRIRNGAKSVATKYTKKASTKFQRKARGRGRKLTNHVCHALSAIMLKRISHVPEGGNWRAIPRRLLPAGMRRAKPKDHTKRYGRLSRKGLASTVLTKCDPHWGAYVHPTQQRTISVREAARLQGFPDSFEFATGYIGKHYEQVGNAVPVPLAFAIGRKLRSHVRLRGRVPKKHRLQTRRPGPARSTDEQQTRRQLLRRRISARRAQLESGRPRSRRRRRRLIPRETNSKLRRGHLSR
jgi:DNA (cytosine-5)-methyltransferase 1